MRQLADRSASGGFTIIEVLVATFIIGTTVVGLFGLFVLSLRLAQEGERRVVAIALANERAEMVRNLPYANVGTSGGIPVGALPQSEQVVRNGVTYTVATDIRYIDDVFDGVASGGGSGGCVDLSRNPPGNPGACSDLCVAPAAVNAHLAHGDSTGEHCDGSPIVGPDVLNTDYKQVRIEVSWPSPNNARPVLLLMTVSPDGIEGGEAFGTLDFQALDAQGQSIEAATVQLYNDTVNPVVDITTLTNSEGRVVLPGLPEAIQSYELTVSRTGYTSEQTYDATATFFPDTDHAHLSALIGELTEKTFFIDQVARLDVQTQEPSNPASLDFDPAGGDDYVEIAHSTSYELSDGSISLWFKARDVADPQQGIWSKDSFEFDAGGHLTVQLLNDQLQVRHQSDTESHSVQVGGIEAHRWYHVVYTFGAGGMQLFVDGAAPATNTYTGGIASNTEPMAIGAGTWQSGDGVVTPIEGPLDGLVDEVRLYDRALDQSEAQTLAQGGSVASGLIGYWALDESSGSSSADSAGGNNGTWQGGLQRSFDTAYVGDGGAAIGSLDYTIQGTKTIGTDDLAQPVYKVSSAVTTDGSGSFSHEGLEWDTYDFSVDGILSGYDIRASNLLLPLAINPAADLDLTLYLVDHTARSLHVTVVDTNNQPIADAVVRLSDNGHDETIWTDALGQVFLADLPVNADYTIDIAADGFGALNTSVTVADTTRETFQLAPSP